MSNCYIFGFGGSGARVIESFTFVLAAASATKNPEYGFLSGYTFVPILVDLDQTNGNKTKTTDLLKCYSKIAWEGGDGKGQFFGLPIKSINEICGLSGPKDNFELPIQMDNQGTLAEVIDYDRSNVDDRALSDLLFKTSSRKDRDLLTMSLSMGFKGGPHVGSVVMSKLADEESVRNFCNKLNTDDRIIMIASAFGGTGAAGAPLFARMLRGDKELPKENVRRDVQISLVSVLPYFSLTDDKDGMVKPNSFMIKTKAALTFYTTNKDFSHIYYVGTNGLTTTYGYSEGGSTQLNKAHMIEVIGALSIFQFLKQTQGNNSWDRQTRGFDYGLDQDDNSTFHLKSLDRAAEGLLLDNWIAFYFAGKYATNRYPAEFSGQLAYAKGLNLKNFGVSDFFNNYQEFWTKYFIWLVELENEGQLPSFVPFKQNAKDVYQGVNGYPIKFGAFGGSDMYKNMESNLNTQAKNVSAPQVPNKLFLEYTTKAAKQALQKYEKKFPLTVHGLN